MEKAYKACCFSGHRIEKLSCSIASLENALHIEIDCAIKDGYDTFYHGGCTGVDLIAAAQILLHRSSIMTCDPRHIHLIAVLPFEGQADHWNEYWRERYFSILSQCDEVITLHTSFCRGCYQERNRYMVDHSDRLIAVYDGVSAGGTKNTLSYAQRKNIDIRIVDLNSNSQQEHE